MPDALWSVHHGEYNYCPVKFFSFFSLVALINNKLMKSNKLCTENAVQSLPFVLENHRSHDITICDNFKMLNGNLGYVTNVCKEKHCTHLHID